MLTYVNTCVEKETRIKYGNISMSQENTFTAAEAVVEI